MSKLIKRGRRNRRQRALARLESRFKNRKDMPLHVKWEIDALTRKLGATN